LESILGDEDTRIFSHHFDVREDGNVDPAQDPHGELVGKVGFIVDRSYLRAETYEYVECFDGN
jgi:hypothetical protein